MAVACEWECFVPCRTFGLQVGCNPLCTEGAIRDSRMVQSALRPTRLAKHRKVMIFIGVAPTLQSGMRSICAAQCTGGTDCTVSQDWMSKSEMKWQRLKIGLFRSCWIGTLKCSILQAQKFGDDINHFSLLFLYPTAFNCPFPLAEWVRAKVVKTSGTPSIRRSIPAFVICKILETGSIKALKQRTIQTAFKTWLFRWESDQRFTGMTFPSSLQNLTLVMINLAIFWGRILTMPLEHVLVHIHHTPAQTHRPFNPPDLFILFLQGNQVSSEWTGASNGLGRRGRVIYRHMWWNTSSYFWWKLGETNHPPCGSWWQMNMFFG